MAKRFTTPKFLPPDVAKKWNVTYDEALKDAKLQHPEDENTQHTVAHKAANKLLVVPAPDSAEAIEKMPAWQKKLSGTRLVDGVEHAFVITTDGRKYMHPILKKKTATAAA